MILYELLTGTTPVDPKRISDASFDELRRIIREDEPLRPSTRLNLMPDTRDTVAENGSTDKVYKCASARSRISGSQAAAASFALAAGNTNPQGIADPRVLAAGDSVEVCVPDAGTPQVAFLLDEPRATLNSKLARRGNNGLRSVSVQACAMDHTPSLVYPVAARQISMGESPRRAVSDGQRFSHDDLFAEWESDPLELLSLPYRCM